MPTFFGVTMKWYEAAYMLSNTAIENARILNMRKKLAKGLRQIWRLSKSAQNALQFQSCFIGNDIIIVYGKKNDCEVQIVLNRIDEKIIAESTGNFNIAETTAILKTLRYNIASNFDSEITGINIMRGIEYVLAWT